MAQERKKQEMCSSICQKVEDKQLVKLRLLEQKYNNLKCQIVRFSIENKHLSEYYKKYLSLQRSVKYYEIAADHYCELACQWEESSIKKDRIIQCLEKEKCELKDQFKVSFEEITEINEKLEQSKRINFKYQCVMTENQQKINGLEQELRMKDNVISQCQQKINGLGQELGNKEQIISKKNEELTVKEQKINGLKRELGNKEQIISGNGQELKAKDNFISQCQKDLKTKEKELNVQDQKIKDLEVKLMDGKELLSKKDEELKAKDNVISQIKRDLEEQKIKEYEEESIKLKNTIETQSEQLRTYERNEKKLLEGLEKKRNEEIKEMKENQKKVIDQMRGTKTIDRQLRNSKVTGKLTTKVLPHALFENIFYVIVMSSDAECDFFAVHDPINKMNNQFIMAQKADGGAIFLLPKGEYEICGYGKDSLINLSCRKIIL